LLTTVVVEVHRVKCPDCGVKVERVPLLPSKAPFSERFENAVGQACESASARQVARHLGLAESTVRAIDLRYLERWAAGRKGPKLRHLGVDEIYLGRKQKFITVVSNLETAEPLWFGKDRKQATLDRYFETEMTPAQRNDVEAACVDMWKAFPKSLLRWCPRCLIVYDKCHVIQHANQAVDEVRRAEFFRKSEKIAPSGEGQTLVAAVALGEPGWQAAPDAQ
jgi:transposase